MSKQQLCEKIRSCASEYLSRHPKETPYRIWNRHTHQLFARDLQEYIGSVANDDTVTAKDIITEVQRRANDLSCGELRGAIGEALIQYFSKNNVMDARTQTLFQLFERDIDDIFIVGHLLQTGKEPVFQDTAGLELTPQGM